MNKNLLRIQEYIGLATLGTGLWWIRPWLCLVVIGIIIAASAAFNELRSDKRHAG